ncbi:imelysin family protein [Stutzerimonas kirkiae]|uniref:Peptidase n=1 Tax=Stutzerimonas kirkiae TaxID=2211392 RepID=A0A4Q9RDF9_9GAMM|nr:imelysin family protein [Stutzerimonas kirkiae]TBU99736.1 peptidase [Stutzerimonas kirkiae]TBV05332.1 peptidase [Stutzerimonas kirkiae]TBV11767.1 peptidase [Stutzerimonas kirkiae]TBV15305.1 peptidase [Stutzerimonas kirkiae]
MPRTPIWATASLLAVAIALAGCGEDKQPATQATESQPATQAQSEPATATGQYDEQAARAVVKHYAEIAHAAFGDAHGTALELQKAVQALIAEPGEATLQAAKDAWLAARVPYMQTEVFRFGNTLVDDWEGQVNAWPLDEGLIDYVEGDYQHALGNPGATANIIANTSIQVGEDTIDISEITAEALADLNELAGSEANVATGYHAIEFLLWGQDLNGTEPGAGQRPYTDYLVGEGATGDNNERRRTYLRVVTELLVDDLAEMTAQWQAGDADNYRASLEAEPVENGLRKILFGMGSLSLGELAGERMKVSLEANSTEDEHDCFSDNTHNSHFYNGLGIRNVYLGEYRKVDGSTISGPSLSSLVEATNAQVDATLKSDLDETQARLQVLVDSANDGEAFDQLIASGNTAGNQKVSDAIAALVKQTAAIEQAAAALGISDLNPDTADHEF